MSDASGSNVDAPGSKGTPSGSQAGVDARTGTVLDARYRLAERIAAGGMGVVYKAERIGIGKQVAIKFLHETFAVLPDLVRRFEREAAAMSRLAHPNVISVIDYGVSSGAPYLVMEYQAGRSLGDVLQMGPLPGRRAVGIARQILSGMRHAHVSGVVHRDLKPDNIILLSGVDGDFVKILDFGLAKVVRGEADESQLTNAGFALGTPGYMSPEQAQGGQVDLRSDIYSVGIILYEMIVGKKPFLAESPIVVLRMQVEDPPEPPRKAAPRAGLSGELEAVVLRALEKPVLKRWQTAAQFAAALEATPEGRASEVPLVDISMHEIGLSGVDDPALRATMHPLAEPTVRGGGPLAPDPTPTESEPIVLQPPPALASIPPPAGAEPWAAPTRPANPAPPVPAPTGAAAAPGDLRKLPPPRTVPLPPVGLAPATPAVGAPIPPGASDAPPLVSPATVVDRPKVVVIRRGGLFGKLLLIALVAAGGFALAWARLHPKSAEELRKKLAEASRVVSQPGSEGRKSSPTGPDARRAAREAESRRMAEVDAKRAIAAAEARKAAAEEAAKKAEAEAAEEARKAEEASRARKAAAEEEARHAEEEARARKTAAEAEARKAAEEEDRARKAAAEAEARRIAAEERASQPPPPVKPPPLRAPDAAPLEDEDSDIDEEPQAPRDTPGVRMEQSAPSALPTSRPPTLHDAWRLLETGQVDEAIRTLYLVRRRQPRDPDVALLLGHAYFKKVWRTDGLREYAEAIRMRGAVRRDRQLVRNTVSALDDPTYRLARAVIRRRIGRSALGELRQAARASPNPKVKRRAAKLANQMTPARRRHRRR